MAQHNKLAVFGSSHVRRLKEYCETVAQTEEDPRWDFPGYVRFFGTGGLRAGHCKRQLQEVCAWRPDYAFIVIGGNDATPGKSAESICRDILRVRDVLLQSGCRRVHVALLARRLKTRFISPSHYEVIRRAVNDLLCQASLGNDLVSLHRRWQCPQGYVDGLHANAKGHRQLLKLIRSCFRSAVQKHC